MNDYDNAINSKLIIEVKPTAYYNEFRNTNNLPITSIFEIIEDEYPTFLSDPNNKNISLSSLFDINYKGYLFSSKGKFNGTNIKNKTTFSLEKLITYLIYTKSSYLLQEKNNVFILNIPGLKSQVGKDISRLDVLINNQKQNFSAFLKGGNPDTPKNNTFQQDNTFQQEEEQVKVTETETETNNDVITDKYIEILMNTDPGKIIDNMKLINFNIINEINILSCQSIFNFIAELIQIQIKNIAQSNLVDNYVLISPTSKEDANGASTISNAKELRVFLNQQSKILTIYFDSYLFTSSDFVSVGRVTFELSLDLMNNSFQFDNLNIEYNLEAYTPKYTMAQTAKYYGITKPTRYLKKKLTTTVKGGRRKGVKTRKGAKSRKTRKTRKGKRVVSKNKKTIIHF